MIVLGNIYELHKQNLNAFINLDTNDLNQGIDYCSLESFVVALYCKQKVSAEVATLADL